MDDELEPAPKHPPSIAKMSKTPSWIMLGFVLGAFVVWMLPREEKSAAPVPERPSAAAPERARVALTSLSTIEAVFAAWGHLAVWDNDLTEVALWSSTTNGFSEFYEVKRSGETLYFRSLTKLTHPILRHGKPPPSECPLQFTESPEQRREWQAHGRQERPADEAAAASANPKFRGMQVFDVAKIEQMQPPKTPAPPPPKVEPQPITVPPKP